MYGERVLREKSGATPDEAVILSVKNSSKEGIKCYFKIGAKTMLLEQDRVVEGDFSTNKNNFYIAYIVFAGSQNILKVAQIPEKGGNPEYVEQYVGPFSNPKIIFHQGEQLIFANYHTFEKSRTVCIRRGECFDVSAGGSNYLTSIVDMEKYLVAAIDCNHFIKQEEKINGGIMPFDSFGVQILRKPALLIYQLNMGMEGGLLRSDADAFLAGGSQVVQLARRGKKFFGAYMRLEKSSYVLYVTDFSDVWTIADTLRIKRQYDYKIKMGKHEFSWDNGSFSMPVEGGIEIAISDGKPCGKIDLRDNARVLQNKKIADPTKIGHYWGDLRVRTNTTIDSNNVGWHCGDSADKYMSLKHYRGLDFVALSDHDSHIEANAWQDLMFNNELYNIDGEFVAFNAYEWVQNKGMHDNAGHYNIVFNGRGDCLRGVNPDNDTVAKLEANLQNPIRANLITAVNTNIVPQRDEDLTPIDWREAPKTTILTEVFNARGNFEMPDCPMQPAEFSRRTVDSGCVNIGLKSLPLGFVGGGGHEGIGVTCVLSYGLSREAVFDALLQRRCYATTGAKIMLDYTVNGEPMGSLVQAGRKLVAKVVVEGTNDIVEAMIITDQGQMSINYKSNRVNTTVNLPDNIMYAYIRIIQKDKEMAWSSPIFLI